MNSSRITYAPRPDATSEAEISALSTVYKLVLNSVNRNAPGVRSTKGGDAMKGSKNDNRAKSSIHE
jgi:hypothetical protein